MKAGASSNGQFMFPETPVVSTKINMNSDFFSSKVFKNRDVNNISHNKSFFDNAGDSDEEEKSNNVSRTGSFTGGVAPNANQFRKSVVNLGIDHRMLMNANTLKTTKNESVSTLSKIKTLGIETIEEKEEGVQTPGLGKSNTSTNNSRISIRPSVTSIGALGSMGIQEKAANQIKNILAGVDDASDSDDDDEEDSNSDN
jgi:hypothetical protein